MIRISELKIPVGESTDLLKIKAARMLRVSPEEILSLRILKRSLDARRKPELFYVYTIELHLKEEHLKSVNGRHNIIMSTKEKKYALPDTGREKLHDRPVIVGSGPAGLFCAYLLAANGFRPLILERGDDALTRTAKVDTFWKTGLLDPSCNVQFGEGGAGTFSDGKLNTSVKDPSGRKEFVLETFVRHGAPQEILYDARPHLGTDILTGILLSMREEIIRMGGEYRFRTCVTDIRKDAGGLKGLILNDQEFLAADAAVLALGHSARDTIAMLKENGLALQAKAFAVGLRIEHPQEMINRDQYGKEDRHLPAAAYKLTHPCTSGRGVYTFCMCPGGYVVNASSEKDRLCVNGMSCQARDAANANSAVVVTVSPEDCISYGGTEYPPELAGIAFQRELEERAFACAEGRVPVQLFADYAKKQGSSAPGAFSPCIKGAYAFGRVDSLLPDFLYEPIREGILDFGKKIRGYDRDDAILSGIESRTSSPVRMLRGDSGEANIKGIYPCGEGAGYAGGIMSAAIDGMRTAEAISEKFVNLSGREGRLLEKNVPV